MSMRSHCTSGVWTMTAARREKSLSVVDMMVCYLLLGMDQGMVPRMQAEVAKCMRRSSKTISEHCKKMEEMRVIERIGRNTRQVLYKAGQQFAIWEQSIMEAGMGKSNPPTEVPMGFAVHTSGTQLMFKAIKVGEMETIPIRSGSGDMVECALFRGCTVSVMKGSTNYNTTVTLSKDERGRFKLRLQVTSTQNLLYITPKFDVIVSSEEAQDYKICIERLVRSCYPILNHLEKYGGWQFEKDKAGRYSLHNEILESQVHRACRGPVGNRIANMTGKIGVSDQTEAWVDGSNGLEVETNSDLFVEAFASIPETYGAVKKIQAQFSTPTLGLMLMFPSTITKEELSATINKVWGQLVDES